jgi:DNA-nicking Smr family endonuclease
MSRDGGGKPGRHSTRTGQLTEDEAELWHQLGRSLDKVKKKPRVAAHSDTPVPSGAVPPGVGRRASGVAKGERPRPAPRHPTPDTRHPPPAPSPPSPPAEIDRRTLRQVGAGKVPIDAVLDLHGLTQEAAHSRLRGFLMRCQAKGHRMVLVVTGKGAKPGRSEAGFDDYTAGAAQRGVLRRAVPLWLEEPELRAIVVSYAAAGVRHGGEGALYIRLRKARGG